MPMPTAPPTATWIPAAEPFEQVGVGSLKMTPDKRRTLVRENQDLEGYTPAKNSTGLDSCVSELDFEILREIRAPTSDRWARGAE